MNVLVVGGGGREHALAWKLSRCSSVSRLFCAPGNPGISAVAERIEIADDDVEGLVAFAAANEIDLTVVGPEVPLALGIVDVFQERGLGIFGPSRYAAQLESSKIFAKEFMVRQGIPTAISEVAADEAQARTAVERIGLPLVLKADGLAAGKGVLIIHTQDELDAALDVFFHQRRFGASGDRVLVEPFLVGEEVSYMGLSDGDRLLPLATSKDYKRIGENDTGPNTGGMGSHSPASLLPEEGEEEIFDRVLRQAVRGMAEEGHPLVGVVYAGLMLTDEGPRVLEFNIRFGDPEAQVLLMRLEDDLAAVLLSATRGGFTTESLRFSDKVAACIVLANRGYPDRPAKGDEIGGLDSASDSADVEVFHAGTGLDGDRVVATGGRVLNVCALGVDLEDALEKAYRASESISWPNKVLRRDIGRRVLAAGRP